MVRRNLSKLALALTVVLMASCSEDDAMDNPDMGGDTNSTSIYITDAPVDQANVQAVFITVSDVMVNGESIEGFNTTTIELSSLTAGKTELLGQLNLDAGSTNDITLKLADTDAAGNAPGNYVMLDGNIKDELGGAMEIKLSDSAEIMSEVENELVLDFDLRKSIVQNGDDYSFVSESMLESNIRAVNTANAGMLSGTVDNSTEADAELVIAYVYPKGSFSDSEEEMNSEGVLFANAASSAVVSSEGDFEIHYLDEGDYELHFASYKDEDADGMLEFNSMIGAETSGALDLNGFTVDAETETEITISFTGLLGL
ncbi:MAG: DUF4382 domain-containing protein [Christiangramia sp.]|uniref:DUF4382 domain-containing protein n=1 Tax=Christiangramia sp. TaxID=1931228 RepID=UPI0032428BB1